MARREQILPPYTRRVDDLRHRIVQLVGGSAVILLAVLFGFVIALFGLYGWVLYAVPLVLLLLLALWMAPDVDTDADLLILRLYFLFTGVVLIWPEYIALNLPGLPWISLQRITVFLLGGVVLYAYATSLRLRRELGEILDSHVWLTRILLAWILWQALMVVVGKLSGASRWVDGLFMRYLFCFVSAWMVTRPGRAQQFVNLVLVAAVITSAAVIPEYLNQRPVWVEYIPPFLSLSQEVLESLYEVTLRAGAYRSRSIFIVPLAYAEYLGMLFPFALLAISWAETGRQRWLAIAILMLMLTAGVLTQTRTAYVAIFATVPTFVGLWAWRRYRQMAGKRDMVASAILSLYPAAVLTLTLAVLFVGRVRVRVLGGGTHQYSDAARDEQWAMAIPKILRNPFGYGMGTVREHVPYTVPGGKFTIDSYPINLLIEYGVPGFLLFAGFFLLAIAVGIRVYLRAETRDELIAGAAVTSLVSFLLSRTILSVDGSVNFAFCLAGMILGLWFQQKRRERRGKVADPPAVASQELWVRRAGQAAMAGKRQAQE